MLMNNAFRRAPLGALALCMAALLSACQTAQLVPKIPGLEPYRMTIQQGNNLSQEMVGQLKLGMTREQVRFVLGTPLLMDVFHADRWDYVYYREVPGGKREQRNLSVVFEKDKLARVIGDLVPPDGMAVQPTGFVPQMRPDAPAKPAAPVAQPAGEAPKPAAQVPLAPAFVVDNPAAPVGPTGIGQNWSAASDQPEPKPAPAPAPGESTQKPAADAQEPGFFERMRQKLGL